MDDNIELIYFCNAQIKIVWIDLFKIELIVPIFSKRTTSFRLWCILINYLIKFFLIRKEKLKKERFERNIFQEKNIF
jgi:hypothetical protein